MDFIWQVTFNKKLIAPFVQLLVISICPVAISWDSALRSTLTLPHVQCLHVVTVCVFVLLDFNLYWPLPYTQLTEIWWRRKLLFRSFFYRSRKIILSLNQMLKYAATHRAYRHKLKLCDSDDPKLYILVIIKFQSLRVTWWFDVMLSIH